MASEAERKARAEWPPEKAAAFDRLLQDFWIRAAELAETNEGATLEFSARFNNGKYFEGHLDLDKRYA